jgi:phosphoribosylglycinamide formyltransferase-1
MTAPSASNRKRVAILISGRGSNMAALIKAAAHPAYPAMIVCVISNRPKAAGLETARAHRIPTEVIDHTAFASRAAFDAELGRALIRHGIELVACAGFLRLMTPEFVEQWRDRMMNIHPSLLPAFKGLDTHSRALAAGVRWTGCTVHLVRAEMDDGPIIAQAAVAVRDNDTPVTLAARVLEQEHILYPLALAVHAAGKTQVIGNKVKISGAGDEVASLMSPDLAGALTDRC